MNNIQLLLLFTIIVLFLNLGVHYFTYTPSNINIFTLTHQEKPKLKRFIRKINEPYTPILSMEMFDYENTPVTNRRPEFPFHKSKIQPLVSIITTYYNLGNIIRETALSIQKQTFKNIEWIVVDDGSTTNKPLIDLQKEFDFNMIVLKQNVGLPGARNSGIEKAKGKYYVFLDADDLIEPTFIEKCLWFLETHPTFSFVNTFSIAFENNRYLHLFTHQKNSQELVKKNLFPVTSMIRASVMNEVNNFDASLRIGMEDWDLILKLHEKGHCGYTIEEFLFWYRIHKDLRWKQDEKNSDLKVKFLEMLKTRYPLIFEKGIPKCIELEDNIQVELENDLIPSKKSVLLILNNLDYNAENLYHLEVIEQMNYFGYHFTVVSTGINSQRTIVPYLLKSSADIFDLTKFMNGNNEIFIEYIIKSRKIEIILTSNSEFGYKSFINHPNFLKIELLHDEIPYRKNYTKFIDFTVTSNQYLSKHIKDTNSITIYHGIDSSFWSRTNLVSTSNNRNSIIIYIIQEPNIDDIFIGILHKIKTLNAFFIIDIDKNTVKNSNLGNKITELKNQLGSERIQYIPVPEKLNENSRLQRIITFLVASDFVFISSPSPLDPWIMKSLALENIIISKKMNGRDELLMEPFGILLDYSKPDSEVVNEAEIKLESFLNEPILRKQVQQQAREMIEKINTEEMVLLFQGLFKNQHLK